MKILENNTVELTGTISKPLIYSHMVYGEKFFSTYISSVRFSGAVDIIPVMLSEYLIDVDEDNVGKRVKISGDFRSFNRIIEGRNVTRLELFVFARELEDSEDIDDIHVHLEGYICKQPKYRLTLLGREITDILLAVNRPYGKSDYIPCICWERNARGVCCCGVGTKIIVDGRIQSREYLKRYPDGTEETRTAYEVSVKNVRKEEEIIGEE